MNTAGEQNAKQAFLSLQNLEKIYPNGEKAVYNFNLDIEKNEFLVIVGPSGCGKTTTLRMVAGLEDISSGDIFLEGELLNYKPCKDRRMAIVFQSYALYPQMKVFDNIAFPLTINRYEAPVTDECLQSCFLLFFDVSVAVFDDAVERGYPDAEKLIQVVRVYAEEAHPFEQRDFRA